MQILARRGEVLSNTQFNVLVVGVVADLATQVKGGRLRLWRLAQQILCCKGMEDVRHLHLFALLTFGQIKLPLGQRFCFFANR